MERLNEGVLPGTRCWTTAALTLCSIAVAGWLASSTALGQDAEPVEAPVAPEAKVAQVVAEVGPGMDAPEPELEEEGSHPVFVGPGAYRYSLYKEAPFTWQSFERAAHERYMRAAVFLSLGAIVMGIGLSLVGSEFSIGNTRSGTDRTLLASCAAQLQLGTFLALEGAHSMTSGFVLIGRAYHLQQLARVRYHEGPSDVWWRWYGAGRGARITGSILLHIGATLASAGISYLAPYPACEKLYCGDCEVSAAMRRDFQIMGAGLSITGAVLMAFGAVLLAAGHASQYSVVAHRHHQATAPVQFKVGSRTIAMVW